MTVGFHRRGDPVSVSSLRSVVPSAEAGLHEDWLQFLRAGDGGRPEPNEFAIADDRSSTIVELLGLQEVRRSFALLKDELGGTLLPVASDVVGNYVCLGLGEERSGVYFWDHETGCIDLLADTFSAFLEALRPFDPAAVELKRGQVISAWIDPELLAAERKKK